MKNRNILTILLVLTIIFTIMGGSLAYFTWQTSESQKTVVTFTIENEFSCSADGGGSISSVNIAPTTCTGSYALKRTIKAMPKLSVASSIYMDLWLDINEIGTGLSNSNNFKYALTTSSTSCETGLVTSGTFTGTKAGDKISLLSSQKYTQTMTDTYYLYIWLDKEETSTETMNQSFSLSLNGECSDIVPVTSKTLINNANSESLSYNDATEKQKTNMWVFSHPATDQTDALTDYRYIGSSPNNYIEFNNEVWRIIGVFDNRIKIMKDDLIKGISYDYKQVIGSSTSNYGSNDWTDSQLMYMLNPTPYALKSGYTYENNLVKDANGNIIYQTGCEPASISTSGTYNCTAKNWSLNETSLSQIDKVTYYLGATTHSTSNGAVSYYNFERSNTVYMGREEKWIGYVALPYSSDYAYTFANGVNDICYNTSNSCSSKTASLSWMFKESYMWLINSSVTNATNIFFVYDSGFISNGSASRLQGVAPVVYLKQNTKLTGTGTSTDMYKIS